MNVERYFKKDSIPSQKFSTNKLGRLEQFLCKKYLKYSLNVFLMSWHSQRPTLGGGGIRLKVKVATMTHDHDDTPHAILTLLVALAGK